MKKAVILACVVLLAVGCFMVVGCGTPELEEDQAVEILKKSQQDIKEIDREMNRIITEYSDEAKETEEVMAECYFLVGVGSDQDSEGDATEFLDRKLLALQEGIVGKEKAIIAVDGKQYRVTEALSSYIGDVAEEYKMALCDFYDLYMFEQMKTKQAEEYGPLDPDSNAFSSITPAGDVQYEVGKDPSMLSWVQGCFWVGEYGGYEFCNYDELEQRFLDAAKKRIEAGDKILEKGSSQ